MASASDIKSIKHRASVPLAPLCSACVRKLVQFEFNPNTESHFISCCLLVSIPCATWHLRDPLLFFFSFPFIFKVLNLAKTKNKDAKEIYWFPMFWLLREPKVLPFSFIFFFCRQPNQLFKKRKILFTFHNSLR